MPFELVVAWAGRHRPDRWEDLASDYRRRIARWVPVREKVVRARGAAASPERLRLEGEALVAAVPAGAWTVALDRRGEATSSRALADRVRRWRETWPHPVVFLLGSDLGLAPEVLAGARERLSFGPMTLAHQLARLVLYEQLYRALSIDSGIGYHRETPDDGS
ncbi:MAG TPA: 23S rRNA (pseudouridine(1915)-N(3))-methyltransferase RlmH [Thermoanaerobaculia bacterium]|nr:23S rRNA (pseudouridine(1915)-N(3))-methyltransferase RlmH [Thermoanaerobaculia bacterium]